PPRGLLDDHRDERHGHLQIKGSDPFRFGLYATVWLRFSRHGSVCATMQLHDELGAVRREVVLPVGRDRAWELVTELEGWLADEADLELEPGAEGSVAFADGTRRHAAVEEVDPGRRLVLCWWTHDSDRALV